MMPIEAQYDAIVLSQNAKQFELPAIPCRHVVPPTSETSNVSTICTAHKHKLAQNIETGKGAKIYNTEEHLFQQNPNGVRQKGALYNACVPNLFKPFLIVSDDSKS